MESRGTFTGICLHTPLVFDVSQYCTLLSVLVKIPVVDGGPTAMEGTSKLEAALAEF